MNRLSLIASVALLIGTAIPASAQGWPDKQPVRLIVPAGPGGPNDVLAGAVVVQQYGADAAADPRGKLRALGVTSPTRRPELPDIPAIAESVPGYAVTSFFGIVAPAGTPHDIVERLNREINAGLRSGAMREALAKLNWTPAPGSAEEFSIFISAEAQKWRSIAERANIRID